jgi:cellulose synthase/poly-beta-1,6-N-acetylglucosamine synthase-like glycosyltransferase
MRFKNNNTNGKIYKHNNIGEHMKTTFILLTALSISLSSCGIRMDVKADYIFDPADTINTFHIEE